MADTIDYEHSLTPPDTVTITSHEGRTEEIPLPAANVDAELEEIERAKTREALQTKYAVRPGTVATIQAAEVGTPEPARKVGALGSVISAVLGVVVYYGLDVPPDAEKLLLTFFAGMAILWPTLLETVRGKVAPIEKAQALIDAAYQMDPSDPRTVKPSIT